MSNWDEWHFALMGESVRNFQDVHGMVDPGEHFH